MIEICPTYEKFLSDESLSVCLSVLILTTSRRSAATKCNSAIWRSAPSVSELCFGLSVIIQSGFTRACAREWYKLEKFTL